MREASGRLLTNTMSLYQLDNAEEEENNEEKKKKERNDVSTMKRNETEINSISYIRREI